MDYILGVLEGQYEIKKRGRLGRGEGDVKNIDMLGRVIEIETDGISMEGDQRHHPLLEDYFGMGARTKMLAKNGYPDEENDSGSGELELADKEASAFRMLAARFNYMAQDNPHMQFAAKGLCRHMSKPKVKDIAKVNELVRFLKGLGPVTWRSERSGALGHGGGCIERSRDADDDYGAQEDGGGGSSYVAYRFVGDQVVCAHEGARENEALGGEIVVVAGVCKAR